MPSMLKSKREPTSFKLTVDPVTFEASVVTRGGLFWSFVNATTLTSGLTDESGDIDEEMALRAELSIQLLHSGHRAVIKVFDIDGAFLVALEKNGLPTAEACANWLSERIDELSPL